MKTKISLMLLGLGLVSGTAYAGAAAEPLPVSNDINVTAPDQTGMWSFGATAVLMQPSNRSFNYADTIFFGPNSAGTEIISNTDNHSVNEGYSWWFGADITYAFPGNSRDVTLAYEGLHGTTTDHTAVASPLGSNSTVLNSPFSAAPYLTAEGETKTNYDAGDLTFGQKLDVGSRIRLHPFLGVRYAHINTQDTGYYTGGIPSASNPVLGPVDPFPTSTYSEESSELQNTFNGIGPRFGSDAQINLGEGFSVRGRLGLAALIGSRTVANTALITYYDVNNVAVGSLYGTNDNDSQTRVVPEIDGRLGLNYTYTFDANTALGFEAGWQATNYFNVIADTTSNSSENYGDNSSFSIQGPYARIQLDIA